MAVSFLVVLAAFSIMASIVALYILIFAFFEQKEKVQQSDQAYVKRDSRIIKIAKKEGQPEEQKPKNYSRFISLVSSVIIGQAVGIYFLTVFAGEYKLVNTILRWNGGFLLLASIICSILTLLNGLLRKKMVILLRLIFQGYSFILAGVLSISQVKFDDKIKEALLTAAYIPNFVIIIYIMTVIVALGLMLWDGMSRKGQHVDFDYSKYFRLVVLVGMIISLGMLLGMQIMHRS